MLKSEDKIFSSPIINLENLEPSYENLENDLNEETNNNQKLKEIFKILKKSLINL